MTDTIKKLASSETRTGEKGQTFLATGAQVAMRLWDEGPVHGKTPHAHAYETVGYAIEGRASLVSGNTRLTLEPGDSWHVPSGVEHAYEIDEAFKAVEATSPPAPR